MDARPVDLVFPQRLAALEAGSCAICQSRILGFRDKLSAKEYGISAMCQLCQDETFREPPEEPMPITYEKIQQTAALMGAHYDALAHALDVSLLGSYIAGGAIASSLLSEPLADVDIFFHEQIVADDTITRIIASSVPVASTKNAVTLKIGETLYQFIREAIDVRSIGTLFYHFDFVHTLGWYDPTLAIVHTSSQTLEAIETRTLILTGYGRGMTERYDRALKFGARGWSIDSDSLATLRAGAVSTGFTLLLDAGTFSGGDSQVRTEIHATNDSGGDAHFQLTLTGDQIRKLRRLRDHGLKFEVRGECELAIVGDAIGNPIVVLRDCFKCAAIRRAGSTPWDELIEQAHAKLAGKESE